MTAAIKLRLTCFALAIGLIALMIGWAAKTTWNEARQLRERFRTVQVESFQIADHFQATILDLNDTLIRYELRKNPADWDTFVRRGLPVHLCRIVHSSYPFSKELAVQIEDSNVVTITTGRIDGQVTAQKRCQAFAPSTRAAS